MAISYDIIVIGSGPGGYTAAIRSAQLGYRLAIIEKYPVLGRTCTNVGCIPAKALLDSSEHFHQAQQQFKKNGIQTGEIRLDFAQFMKRKEEVVRQNTSGLTYLMKKNKIEVHQGIASFVDSTHVRVLNEGIETILETTYCIIATGSKPASIPGIVIDKQRLITSTEVLSLPSLPSTMIIIGGGVIGVEIASVYARLGTQVTIIEYTDSLIPTMDRELGKTLARSLNKLNITTLLGSGVQSAVNKGDEVSITYLDKAGATQGLTAEYCVVAVGRKAYTTGLNAEAIGIQIEKNGKIKVNERLQSAIPTIYAIGDVVDGAMLAHKAEDEGTFVAETIDGQKTYTKYALITSVVYTWPEVASVGETEEQLKQKGIEYRIGKFPYSASSRAN